jgi:hypothetical protein
VNKRISAILECLGLRGSEVTSSGRNKDFVLKVVQPGLAGLMDGSVSTLAPIFATVFATREPYVTFLVGLAAAVRAGISMAFSEGLSDTGELAGHSGPVCGVLGGRGRADRDLPYPLQVLQHEFLDVGLASDW